jgi:hypothetical protein
MLRLPTANRQLHRIRVDPRNQFGGGHDLADAADASPPRQISFQTFGLAKPRPAAHRVAQAERQLDRKAASQASCRSLPE